MREIIFKGLSKRQDDRGKDVWIEGSLLAYPGKTTGIVYNTPINGYDVFNMCIVDPESVGEYTGCKDAYGTKIFEGDIVAFEDGGIGTLVKGYVAYDDSECRWSLFNGDDDFIEDLPRKCEVIGNINNRYGKNKL